MIEKIKANKIRVVEVLIIFGLLITLGIIVTNKTGNKIVDLKGNGDTENDDSELLFSEAVEYLSIGDETVYLYESNLCYLNLIGMNNNNSMLNSLLTSLDATVSEDDILITKHEFNDVTKMILNQSIYPYMNIVIKDRISQEALEYQTLYKFDDIFLLAVYESDSDETIFYIRNLENLEKEKIIAHILETNPKLFD